MNIEGKIIDILKSNKVEVVVAVPCIFFASLLDKLKIEPSIKLIWPAIEKEGLGISAGCYLGGMRSILLIQNSGLGNMVNALKSLNQYYNIPFFAIVSQRGGDNEEIDAQKPMGEVTPKLLNLLRIKYQILELPEQVDDIGEALNESLAKKESRVILVKASFWKEKT